MKTVVSISQGSSEYDYELETRFLGQDFRVVRVGSDGNLDRAEAVLDSVREQANAIGLSMIHDHYQVGREQLQHRIPRVWKPVCRTSPSPPGPVFGAFSRNGPCAIPRPNWAIFSTMPAFLFLNGQAGFRIAKALSEHTDNLLFADPYLDFGVPRLLTSLSQLEAYTKLTAPVMFSPNAVKVIERLHRTPLYRMGEKLISGSLHESVRDCHVIVGAMGDLEAFTEKELDGKTVITSRVTESALDWFRSRKVASGGLQPLAGRSAGGGERYGGDDQRSVVTNSGAAGGG